MNPNEPDNQQPHQPPPFGRPAGQSNAPSPHLPAGLYPHQETPTPQKTPRHRPRLPRHEGWKSVASTALIFLLAPILALVVAAFVIQSYQVDGQSMETTLQNHDRLIVDKFPRTWARLTGHTYIPHRGDIIVFNQSGLPNAAPGQDKQLIKRVIGLPGERVVVKDGVISIYDQSHPNGFNPDDSGIYHISARTTLGNVDVQLPAGQIFVCGDNRGNSEDSRYFGPVDANNVVGKLSLRLLPFNKLQRF